MGAERYSRLSQVFLNPGCDWVRAAEHAPRDPQNLLERCNGILEIVERGGGIQKKRPCINSPHPEREFMTFSQNASGDGQRFAQQCFGFFKAP